jgi:hypothetical protein
MWWFVRLSEWQRGSIVASMAVCAVDIYLLAKQPIDRLSIVSKVSTRIVSLLLLSWYRDRD